MGDKDFRSVVKNAIEAIEGEISIKIDAENTKIIHLKEAVQCLRRSYYDRTNPLDVERIGFNQMISGLVQKLSYGSKSKDYAVGEISLRGQADIIADDYVILFRPADSEPDTPKAGDLLFLNACMWIYEKQEGMIVYVTGNEEESMFAVTRDKKMFEEVIRRTRILNDLLNEKKTPVLEPSIDCNRCQYYQRCFITKKNAKQVTLAEMLGFTKKN